MQPDLLFIPNAAADQKTPQIATITFSKYNIRKKKKKPFFI